MNKRTIFAGIWGAFCALKLTYVFLKRFKLNNKKQAVTYSCLGIFVACIACISHINFAYSALQNLTHIEIIL